MEAESEILIEELVWSDSPKGNVQHIAMLGLLRVDIYEVLGNAPEFFRQLSASGLHVMIGPKLNGRFLFVVMVETPEAGYWYVVTAYHYSSQRALRYYGKGK